MLTLCRQNWATTGAQSTVLVEDGTYLSGQVELQSGVTLSVSPDTVLLASAAAQDYPTDQDAWAFVYANGVTSVGVTGGGVIDGQQALYVGGFNASQDKLIPLGWPGCTGECRPRLVKLVTSSNIEVSIGGEGNHRSSWCLLAVT